MARQPDAPCVGCGRLLWGGTTSLPAGERLCQPCRRARKNAEPDEDRPTACGYCSGPFVSKRRSNGRWARACSRSCARRLQIAEGSHTFIVRPGPPDLAAIWMAAEETDAAAVRAVSRRTGQPTENTTTGRNAR